MDHVLEALRQDFPAYQFAVSHGQLRWSPSANTIFYPAEFTPAVLWGIMHELGHAELGHQTFTTDVGLVRQEAAAWAKARQIARTYAIVIDEEHIADCLDSYRDWLHRRSTCPTCKSHGLQHTPTTYTCLNCKAVWSVGVGRFCRTYRKVVAAQKISGI